jgi:hypothetical protein
METFLPLASALGLGMLAGLRLYATVFGLGLLLRLEWLALPAAWHHAAVLADTRVLIVSGLACAIEFAADKIPWVDSAWDALHTFIRPIGAALLTSSLFSDLEPVHQVLLFLLAGGVALSGHAAKAATRLAVNHSPEPFSNAGVSLIEDLAVAAGLYVLVKHPWVLAAAALLSLLIIAWLAPRVYHALRAEAAALSALMRNWFAQAREIRLRPAEQRWLAEHWQGRTPRQVFAVIATPDLRGLNNRLGALCLGDTEAVFFTRKWAGLVAREFKPLTAIEVRKGFLMDELTLVLAGGSRIRLNLLAGQFASARQQMRMFSPPTPLF